ncbi:MAG: rhodanese-like domain-containing protein [Planctomycetes bacterium]|nr:rhodanese-like domain-containing protein [Planctomycetota bacterium]
MNFEDLDPADAQRRLQQDPSIRLLDVRTQPEHDSHRLPNAKLVPVQELAERIGELDRDQRWLVYCEHGVRSVAACEMLAAAGFEAIANIRGGMAHWASQGLPYESRG